MIDFSAVMLVISEGLRIAFTVANLSCNGGPYEPFRVTALAAVSLLLVSVHGVVGAGKRVGAGKPLI